MAQSGGEGEAAAKRTNLSTSGADAGEDRLSALPDEILISILLRLEVNEAAQTSVLSKRWRRIWARLPELLFCFVGKDLHVPKVLEAREATAPLQRLDVITAYDSPASVAAWLPLAARLLSGDLIYANFVEEEAEVEVEGTILLPCFEKATGIDLNLGYLALALPSSGVFTTLTRLYLDCIRFQGTCELGDIVSSPRCPSLKWLCIEDVWGVTRLTVHSESLFEMDLLNLNGLQRLNIDAPVLDKLAVQNCFTPNQPAANISTPRLNYLFWRDAYDPNYVQLGDLGQLRRLTINYIIFCGDGSSEYNHEILLFLQHFQVLHRLEIGLCYPAAPPTCPPGGCICDQPTNWKIEKLSLTSLKEVEITGLKGAEHEVAFLEQLFNWAVVLEKLKITFDCCVSKSEAKELCQRLLTISRPETLKEFRMYRDSQSGPEMVELLLLEDEGGTEV